MLIDYLILFLTKNDEIADILMDIKAKWLYYFEKLGIVDDLLIKCFYIVNVTQTLKLLKMILYVCIYSSINYPILVFFYFLIMPSNLIILFSPKLVIYRLTNLIVLSYTNICVIMDRCIYSWMEVMKMLEIFMSYRLILILRSKGPSNMLFVGFVYRDWFIIKLMEQ